MSGRSQAQCVQLMSILEIDIDFYIVQLCRNIMVNRIEINNYISWKLNVFTIVCVCLVEKYVGLETFVRITTSLEIRVFIHSLEKYRL